MSNDITGNPLILDSAAATVLITKPIRVTQVIVQSGSSGVAGDSCVLKDQRGTVKVDVAIAASKECKAVPFVPPLYMDGLAMTTLSHGVAYVYYEGTLQPTA